MQKQLVKKRNRQSRVKTVCKQQQVAEHVQYVQQHFQQLQKLKEESPTIEEIDQIKVTISDENSEMVINESGNAIQNEMSLSDALAAGAESLNSSEAAAVKPEQEAQFDLEAALEAGGSEQKEAVQSKSNLHSRKGKLNVNNNIVNIDDGNKSSSPNVENEIEMKEDDSVLINVTKYKSVKSSMLTQVSKQMRDIGIPTVVTRAARRAKMAMLVELPDVCITAIAEYMDYIAQIDAKITGPVGRHSYNREAFAQIWVIKNPFKLDDKYKDNNKETAKWHEYFMKAETRMREELSCDYTHSFPTLTFADQCNDFQDWWNLPKVESTRDYCIRGLAWMTLWFFYGLTCNSCLYNNPNESLRGIYDEIVKEYYKWDVWKFWNVVDMLSFRDTYAKSVIGKSYKHSFLRPSSVTVFDESKLTQAVLNRFADRNHYLLSEEIRFKFTDVLRDITPDEKLQIQHELIKGSARVKECYSQ